VRFSHVSSLAAISHEDFTSHLATSGFRRKPLRAPARSQSFIDHSGSSGSAIRYTPAAQQNALNDGDTFRLIREQTASSVDYVRSRKVPSVNRETEPAPDERLLTLLAQKKADEKIQDQANQLCSLHLDWDRLVRRSLEEDVYPLVYHNLRTLRGVSIPQSSMEQLKRLYSMNSLRVDMLRAELQKILVEFSAHDIHVIPLKGIALAESLYGDAYLRASVDIDILIQPGTVRRAVEILVSLGYSAAAFDVGMDFKSNAHDHMLEKTLGSFVVLVELHWAIMWGSALDRTALDLIWKTAFPKSFLGVSVRSLSPEWELLFLAGHAARSLWDQLKSLVDIAERSDMPDIEWNSFWKMSSIAGWNRAVRWSLLASNHVLGRPDNRAIPPGSLPRWIRLFPERPARPFIKIHELSDPRLLDRPSARLRFLGIALFAPRSADRRWLRLPRVFSPLYYLVRPLRIAGVVAIRSMQRLFNCLFTRRGNERSEPS